MFSSFRKIVRNHKKQNSKGEKFDSGPSLDCLTDIPVLKIATYLRPKDLFSFSHCCKNVFDICESDHKVWNDVLKAEIPDVCEDFKRAALFIVDRQTVFSTRNSAKLSVLMHCRTERNWTTGNSVGIKSLTHKFTSEDIWVVNKSNQFLEIKSHYKCDLGDEGFSINLTLWNVITGQVKDFTATIPFPPSALVGVDKRYFLFDNLIIPSLLTTEDQCHYMGFRINPNGDTNLQEVWSNTHVYFDYFYKKWDRVFKSFYLDFVIDPDLNDELIVDGYSTKDGSKLFSFGNIKRPNNEFPEALASEDGWCVLALSDKLLVINYKMKTFKVMKARWTDVSKYCMVLKRGKLLVFHNIDYYGLELIDLASGDVLRTITVTPGRFIYDADFDPFTHEVMTFHLSKGLSDYIKYEPQSEPSKSDHWLEPRGYNALDSMVRLIQLPGDKYHLKLSKPKGVKEKILISGDCPKPKYKLWKRFGRYEHTWQIELAQVKPFFIEVRGDEFVKVVDFLNLDQYLT